MKWKFSAFVFVVCVCQCKAISLPEIEDFSNFLIRTSSLLRSNINPYDADASEDDHISDYAWEESGKFEGDLILNERQRRLIVEDVAHGLSRNGLQDSTKRWPNNEVIYYIQKEHFNSDQLDAIKNGIEDLSQASCVKFRPYKKGDPDAVVIQGSRRGCFSQVGYQGGYQVLNLSGRHPAGRGCFRHGTVVHELLHTLGFYHMQSSPDRDDYINVRWENIVEPAKHNFRKYNSFSVSDFGVGYDYESVLHYGRKAFSSNGQDTLVPRKLGAQIGQRIGLSDKDTQKLNKMYCDADSNNFEADNKPHRHVTKKKTPKNQPFQGHGIGYQKGKTVVIKLPTSETVDLNGNKDEIADEQYYFKPSTNSKENKPIIENTDVSAKNKYKTPIYFEGPYIKYYRDEPEYKPHVQEIKKVSDSDGKILNSNDNKPNADGVSEAFDRLGHILKTHVYPSQTPNLSVYKFNTDYSDFFNPSKKNLAEPDIKEFDQKFVFHNTSPKTFLQNEYLDDNPLYKISRNTSTDYPKNDVEIVKVTNEPVYESKFVTRPQYRPESTILDSFSPKPPFKKYDYSDLYLPYSHEKPVNKLRSNINSDGEQLTDYTKPYSQDDDYYHQNVYPQDMEYNNNHEDSYSKRPHQVDSYRVTYPSYNSEEDKYRIIPKVYSGQKHHKDDPSKYIKHSEDRPNNFDLQEGTDRIYDHSSHDTPENKTNEAFLLPYSDRNREYTTFAQENSDVARENVRKSLENYKKTGYGPVYGDTTAGRDGYKSSHKNSPSQAEEYKDRIGVTPSSYHLDKHVRHEPKVHEDYEYSSENSHSVEGYR